MVAEPAATPVTVPVVLTVAIEGLLLLHTPPAVASIKVLTELGQMMVEPVMAATVGAALTVTVVVVAAVPQLLVTL